MEEELICNDCGWTGDSTMLESETDNKADTNYNYCPDCGSENLEDIKLNE